VRVEVELVRVHAHEQLRLAAPGDVARLHLHRQERERDEATRVRGGRLGMLARVSKPKRINRGLPTWRTSVGRLFRVRLLMLGARLASAFGQIGCVRSGEEIRVDGPANGMSLDIARPEAVHVLCESQGADGHLMSKQLCAHHKLPRC